MKNQDNYSAARHKMVQDQLIARGIDDRHVIAAFYKVLRHAFVDPKWQHLAYEDHPLRIDCDQTISQPYMVALMTQLLRLDGSQKVLEIGTGSGYQTAILAECAAQVYTVERHATLAEQAQTRLRAMGYENIHFHIGDGTVGWPDAAPFDGIIVTAAAPVIPASIKQQLAPGGYLIIPVGSTFCQELIRLHKTPQGEWRQEYICSCVFVKLIGDEGWPNS